MLLIIGFYIVNCFHCIESFEVPSIEVCANQSEYLLTKDGFGASLLVQFNHTSDKATCELRVKAPADHLVYVQFLEDNVELHRMVTHWKFASTSICPLQIAFPSTYEKLWEGNFCSLNHLPPIDIHMSELSLIWMLPKDGSVKDRKILLTSVGQGHVCNDKSQHVCMHIGGERLVCIADELTCNGYHNCPRGSNKDDEEEVMCQQRRTFKDRTNKLMSLINSKSNSTQNKTTAINYIFDWANILHEMNRVDTTTQMPPYKKANETVYVDDHFEWIFFQHGAWGYLALALILCALILLLCCLWEYCLRNYAHRLYNHDGGIVNETSVMNCDLDEIAHTSEPPNYNDLDMPPSYSVLFPNNKIASGDDDEFIYLNSINLTMQAAQED